MDGDKYCIDTSLLQSKENKRKKKKDWNELISNPKLQLIQVKLL